MYDQGEDLGVYLLWNLASKEGAENEIRFGEFDGLDHDLLREGIFDGDVMLGRQREVYTLRERVVAGAKKEDLHDLMRVSLMVKMINEDQR